MNVFLHKVHTSLGVSCTEQRWREALSFDLRGGYENVLCVSVEAQFESLIINPSSLLIPSLSYTLNGHPG